jgi:hypothetical protein
MEYRREFARAGRCGWKIGISSGDQLPYEAVGIREDRRQAQIHDDRALKTMDVDASAIASVRLVLTARRAAANSGARRTASRRSR